MEEKEIVKKIEEFINETNRELFELDEYFSVKGKIIECDKKGQTIKVQILDKKYSFYFQDNEIHGVLTEPYEVKEYFNFKSIIYWKGKL
jgi:hypothetical protein